MIDNVDVLVRQGFRIPVALIGKKTASSIGYEKTKKLIKKNGKKTVSLIHSDEVDEFLAHFGVLGMHWGIRNDKERRAAREAKAKKFEAKANRIQSDINKVKNQTSYDPFKQRKIDELVRDRTNALNDAKAKRQGKFTSRQKKALIGAGAAAAFIAAYSTYRMTQSGEARRSMEKGKAFITRSNVAPWAKKPDLSDSNLDVDGIFEKVVKHINPKYGQPGTVNNCRRATFAYEMRRRGYDVAATRTANGLGGDIPGLYNALSPGEKIVSSGRTGLMRGRLSEAIRKKINPSSATPFTDAAKSMSFLGKNSIEAEGDMSTAIFKSLSKLPNGARGELGVQWGSGGAHSIAWEIVNNKPVIFDSQMAKKMTNADDLNKAYGAFSTIANASFTRLDNAPLNEDFLLRWLKRA